MHIEPGLVSVICCTHNRSGFIRKAIELFMAQTWPKREMIIMDDGSPGTVPDVAGLPIRHVKLDKYTWITQKHRQAFQVAKGELVGYWDDDDWYSARRLALQASPILDGAADATGFHVKLIVSTPDGHFWKWKRSTLDKWALEEKSGLDAPLPFHDGTSLWRRELLEGLTEEMLGGSQIRLVNAMKARGARLLEIPNDGHFAYIRHSGVGWKFDVRDLCEPAECPRWVTPQMVAFWTTQGLPAHGVRRG